MKRHAYIVVTEKGDEEEEAGEKEGGSMGEKERSRRSSASGQWTLTLLLHNSGAPCSVSSSPSSRLLYRYQALVYLLGFSVTYLGFNHRTLKEIRVGFGVKLVGISEYISFEVSLGNHAFFDQIPAFS